MTINLDIKLETYYPSSKTLYCVLLNMHCDRDLETGRRYKHLTGSSLMYS